MTAIGSTKAKQHSLFAFAGDAKICAEIHASTIAGTPDEDSNLKAVINGFTPNLTYQPNAMDYFVIASLLFKHSPELAAPYYKSSLDHLPIGPETLTPRRVITDQLVMSLGMSGDLKGNRAMPLQNTPLNPIPITLSTTTTSPVPMLKKSTPTTPESISNKLLIARQTPFPANIFPTHPG